MKNASSLLLVLLLTGSSVQAPNYYELGLKEFYSDNNNDLVSAVVLFTKAIDNKQQVARSYMMRGASKYGLNHYATADEDLRQSFLMDSSNFEIYGFLARLRRAQMDYIASLRYYDSAVAINDRHNPKRMDLYGERGAVRQGVCEV